MLEMKVSQENSMYEHLIKEWGITNREVDVLRYIVLGKNNNEIADELNLSTHTVKAHVRVLLNKFSVTNRVSLAVKVVKYCLKKDINFDFKEQM